MRRQIAGLVAATTLLVLVAFLLPIALLLRSEAEKRAISAATLEAQSLAPLVPTLAVGSLSSTPGTDFAVSVFLPSGSVIGVPAERTDSIRLAARGEAFVAQAPGGVEVLVPVQGADGTSVIRVLVPAGALHRGVTRAWMALAGLGLVLLGLGVAVVDRLGRRMVSSVTGLVRTADRLAAGDLTARVTPSGPPEIHQVGRELNRLAGRIAELLTAEREEVADLAHRLRTPLTALRLNAESSGDPRLICDVDSLERSVDEVIRTARRPVREGVFATSDLVRVAGDRAAFWAALAEDTGRPMIAQIPPLSLPVRASVEDVAASLDALLGNVFAHTPDGTSLKIEVHPRPPGAVVVVQDGGAGFGGAELDDVVNTTVELSELARGSSGAGSTGLGLDVARRTAEASGGWLVVGRGPLGGARVEMYFGPPGSLRASRRSGRRPYHRAGG